jgi:hypothetical protein
MRRFLYISPYFPPERRVGALRPLKFVRYLRGFGWDPVVLASHPGPSGDATLAAAVPASVEVHYDYGWCSQRAAARRSSQPTDRAPAGAGLSGTVGVATGSGDRARSTVASLVEWLPSNPELFPLGEDLFDLPHAFEAARRVFARGRCEAIVVNADPFAALLVGRSLARETGAPLIADLRDPWAPCELRRPLRPAAQRALVDALERSVVEASAFVVLNTDQARDAYRHHYPDISAERFVTIRNHADVTLIGGSIRPVVDGPFELLVLGHLRRFVEGATLLEAIALLARRGFEPARLRLRVVGSINADARQRMEALGIHPFVQLVKPVPFLNIGVEMAGADLLVVVSHGGSQRIPAKTYEYLTSERPVLAVTDNPELRSLIDRAGGAAWCAHGDVAGVADRIAAVLAGGRRQVVPRGPLGLDSETASRRLARLLDRAGSGQVH